MDGPQIIVNFVHVSTQARYGRECTGLPGGRVAKPIGDDQYSVLQF